MARTHHGSSSGLPSRALPLAVLSLLASCTGAFDSRPAGPTGAPREPSTPPESASISGARRLSQAELDATLYELLGDTTRPAARLLSEDELAPYDNDYTLQRVSRALVESLEQLAIDVADRATADPAVRARIVPCTPAEPGDVDCFRAFVERFTSRAFRRPVSGEDVDAYMPLLAFATEDAPYVDNDFYTAVNLVIRAVIQDPEMLYRLEVGAPTDEPRVAALTDHEIATRISYLLWGTTPDDALMADAAAGRLRDPAGRRAAAERMLSDARARDQLHRFHAMWLGYRAIPHRPELVASFDAETTALIDRVVFDDDADYLDLFTSPTTYLDPSLAAHYGLPAAEGGGSGWVRYPEGSGRAGILSHGAVLAAFSKFTDTSPTQRGIFVRTRLMCDRVAPPPPTVDVDQPPGEGTDAVCKADRYAMHSDSSTSCAGCHSQFDPIGFGLERFDIGGRYRESEAAHPECAIDGAGELPGIGPFSGPEELSRLLVEAGELDDCVVRQLWEFAGGRDPSAAEEPAIQAAVQQFRDSGRSLRTLLIELVASPRFALRAEEG